MDRREDYSKVSANEDKNVFHAFRKIFSGGKKKEETIQQDSPVKPETQAGQPAESAAPSVPESPAPQVPLPRSRPRVRERFSQDSNLLKLYRIWKGLDPEQRCEFGPQDLLSGDADLTEEMRSLIEKAEKAAQELLWRFQQSQHEAGRLQEDVPAASAGADSQVCTMVTGNRVYAYVLVLPPLGAGKPLSQDILNTTLAEEHVQYGIHESVIQSICGSEPSYFKIVEVAEGIRPVDGRDGYIEEVIPRDSQLHLTEKSNGEVDFHDMNWFQQVKEGDVLCKIIPPGEPVDGISVYNNPITANPGKKAVVPAGKNTEVSEDGTELISKIDGQLLVRNDKYNIEQTLTIDGNVDFSTGNLDVTGNLVVRGDICNGFEVRATGDITVHGMIEGASVVAGGSIFVRSGMNGNSKGVLTAGKDIRCKFMENTVASAQGDVYLESAVNSYVNSWGSVMVKSGKGVVIGGEIIAMKGIEAKSVGSKLNLPTYVGLVRPESFSEEKNKLKAQREKLLTSIERKEQEGTAHAIESLKERDVQARLESMRDLEETMLKSLMRFQIIYPNTTLAIGHIRVTVREEHNQNMIYLKEGEITFGSG